ncbi:prolyl oligopeptidase family protein [uncultured Sphingomonas sp.]|uniref:prolyl oligopeptidase family serine peptidase n=1 Tax=uncultured Sphingomonas sp. TaxID=158754 RepID=UPI0035C98D7F
MRMMARLLSGSIVAGMLAAAPALAQTRPMSTTPSTASATSNDPYLWLEDKDGARSLAWVEQENARSLPRLQGDTRYATFYQEALAIASAKDRIPAPELSYGRVLNFWRDADHPHGLWRWTTEADYATAAPHWTTLIDLDALGKAEGKTWVWKGSTCLKPEERLCLVALSEGGEDAVTYREFDLETGQFVANGFLLPKSKQDATWIDKDTLLVSRDWGAGTTTQSGYPFVVKEVKRGAPLDQAREVYRGAPTDQVSTGSYVLIDAEGHRAVFIRRGVTFFTSETYLMGAKGLTKLDIPARTMPTGLIDGQLIFSTDDPWGAVPAGAIASAPLAQVERGIIKPTVIFAPGPRQSVEQAALTKDHALLVVSDNVRGRAFVYTHGALGWSHRPLDLPDNATIGVAAATDRSDHAYLSVTGFLTPTSLYALDASAGAPHIIKTLPAKFDASGLVVEQYEAASSDGTKIPYFVVHRHDVPLDGTTPTIMTAYGGFQVSMTPTYSGSTGKLWLERGGSFVLANIRGGGEFGPAWHDAGRKTKRQIIYDDFAAVAKDLETRKLTSPAKLGIYGGSNGGLLMGVEFNQHQDLWSAVVIQVPLLDMIRYEHIAAGASWVDEYGSASIPAERAFLETISPYQNLRKGVSYPEPFIWTTTKDDRVGPQHARKFAARMQEYGLPYLFYEDTAGGHSGDADIAQGARIQALQMTYFAQKLIGPDKAAVTAAR